MDPDAVFERAEVTEYQEDVFPGGSAGPTWVATDPETGCRGVGTFEKESRTNLVYAVESYRDDPDRDVPYVSSGKGATLEMNWADDDGTLTDRLRALFPF
jgi:hypothetical protein